MDLCRRRKSHRHHLTRFNRPSKSAHPSAMGGEATSTRLPSARILSAFCSLIPLIVHNVFLGVNATASTVWKPASESFFVSCADIPTSYSQRKSHFFFFFWEPKRKYSRWMANVPGVWPPGEEPAIRNLPPRPLRPAG